MEAHRTRLAAWQGTLAVMLGGIAGQLAGAAVFVIAIVLLVARHGIGALSPEALLTRGDLLAASIAATGLAMTGAALVSPLLARIPLRSALGFVGAPWPCFVAAPIGILALGPTSDVLHRVMQTYLPGFTLGSIGMIDSLVQSAPLVLVLPLLSLLPGISEELLFRGAFQRSISNAAIAIPLSGLLFAAYHLDPHHVVAVVPLGLYLAWVAHRTQSTLVPILAHVTNNATAVLISVSFPSDDAASHTAMSAGDIASIPLGWVVASLAMYVVWWSTRRAQHDTDADTAGAELGAIEPPR